MDASDIAAQVVGAETDASVAAAAAQTAVAAADAAVVMAEVQTAQVVAQAAAEIQEANNEAQALKDKVSWLENQLTQTQAAMEAQNMATMATLAEMQALVLAMKSADSPSPTPPASEAESTAPVQVNNPSGAVVVQQEA